VKVLVVCSEAMARMLLESTLGRAGHDVVSCRSGQRALEEIAGVAMIDVAFVDRSLAGDEALAVCRALRQRAGAPAFLAVLTKAGPVQDRDAAFAREVGADRSLPRPLSVDAINACLRAADAARRPRVEAPKSEPVSAGHDKLAGKVLDDKYEVLELIGRGGMGTVYRARHRLLNELVALKVIHGAHANRPGFRERFLREARAMLRVVHPNVITVRDCSSTGKGLLYLTMDLSSGRCLGDVLRQAGRLPEERAARLGRQMALALAAAHERGIVHRDLKPDNVLLEKDDQVRVCDFGLAKLLDAEAEAEANITTAGTVVGTPFYIAPEQAAGESVDGHADVYSLGCIIYEMICGARVFEARTVSQLLRAHLTTLPVAPSARGARVGPRLEALVLRMLSKEPDDRPTAAAVAAALTAITDRPARKGDTLRVLVADDSAVNRALLGGVLERWGHQVTLARDGVEAFERYEAATDAFDLVILDGDMPRMDGREAARAIRRRDVEKAPGRRVPIVALTASAGPADRERCAAAGMDELLAKPIRVEELVAVVSRAVSPSGAAGAAGKDDALFDHRAALARVEGDHSLLRDTIQLLIEDLERILEELRAGKRQNDTARMARAAHELKGSAGNCGAVAIAAAASRLEALARSGRAEETREALELIERDVARTLPVLLRSVQVAA
jgi:CheY-like chemotaxis protein/HPt (histidine-containing phosphotransfer) domain-containing protein